MKKIKKMEVQTPLNQMKKERQTISLKNALGTKFQIPKLTHINSQFTKKLNSFLRLTNPLKKAKTQRTNLERAYQSCAIKRTVKIRESPGIINLKILTTIQIN